MIRWLTGLGTAIAAGPLRDLMLGVGVAVVVAVFAAVSLGFGTFAVYLLLREGVGDAFAALIICAIYAVIAGTICAAATRRRRARRLHRTATATPAPATDIEQLIQSLNEAGISRDQGALIAAMRMGQELSPSQLLVVALIGGFIAGRRLGK